MIHPEHGLGRNEGWVCPCLGGKIVLVILLRILGLLTSTYSVCRIPCGCDPVPDPGHAQRYANDSLDGKIMRVRADGGYGEE